MSISWIEFGKPAISVSSNPQRSPKSGHCGHLRTCRRPLISPEHAKLLNDELIRRAFVSVFTRLISIMPGNSWAKTSDMKQKFGIL
jgi:hypothetical protein